jgi:hypothetical protein
MNPKTPKAASVSVTLPITQAIERVKCLLFRPFDLGRWFVIGFCAWLATLGQGASGASFRFPGHFGNTDWRDTFEEARQFVFNNLHWIVPLAVVFVLIGLVFWVVFTWLSSRGRFMFLHCVALNKAEVKTPWHAFAPQGNSLCWFRLVVHLIGMAVILPLMLLIAVLIVEMVRRESAEMAGILGVIGLGLAALAGALVFALVGKLTTDFVVPIMVLRSSLCLAAWKECFALLAANFWRFVLYLLFQVVLGILICLLVLTVVIVTCCCAGCLMAIPYLGTVLLLPILVFGRAYSVYYLAQYGPTFDVFLPSEQPTSTSAA